MITLRSLRRTALSAALLAGATAAFTASPGFEKSAEARYLGRPNLQHYCNVTHPGSRARFSHRRNRLVCQYPGFHRAFSIRVSRACRLTYGTPRYRYVRSRANPVCIRRHAHNGHNGHAGHVRLVRPRLQQYCQARFGHARARFSPRYNRWVCRTVRHHRLRQYSINMRRACRFSTGSPSYRYLGNRRNVACVVRT